MIRPLPDFLDDALRRVSDAAREAMWNSIGTLTRPSPYSNRGLARRFEPMRDVELLRHLRTAGPDVPALVHVGVQDVRTNDDPVLRELVLHFASTITLFSLGAATAATLRAIDEYDRHRLAAVHAHQHRNRITQFLT